MTPIKEYTTQKKDEYIRISIVNGKCEIYMTDDSFEFYCIELSLSKSKKLFYKAIEMIDRYQRGDYGQ